jgi:FMN-dependent NADH-azoreductase
LKSWIDHLVRAGITFSYATGQPAGLLEPKKVYLVAASGGVYSDGPYKPYDFQVPYIKSVLGFIGLTDVETVRVEGVAGGQEAAEKAVSGALEYVAALAV